MVMLTAMPVKCVSYTDVFAILANGEMKVGGSCVCVCVCVCERERERLEGDTHTQYYSTLKKIQPFVTTWMDF